MRRNSNIRNTRNTRVVICAVTCALIASIVVTAQPVRAFKVGVHEELTAQALSFLNPAILDDINGEHLYQDTVHAFDSEHHFDNCELKEGTDYINQQYTRPNGIFGDGGVLAELDPGDPQPFDATDEFGQLLHTAEDFYAHSNWVELGRTDLVDSSLGLRTPLTPWGTIREGVVIAEGEDLPSGWSIQPGANPKVPRLATGTGQVVDGLMSGTFGLADECNDAIAVKHGSDDAESLNKDNASRAGFAAARDLASRQVQHEWCRMLHLLNGAYGYAGASIAMGLWVDPSGYPHPVGTACAPQTHTGENNVTISLRSVTVLNDQDPFADGEINLSFVLYTGDFRDSVRKHVGPIKIGSGDDVDGNTLSGMSLTLPCLAGSDTGVLTLQGWDDDAGTNGLFDDALSDPDDVLKGVTATTNGGNLGRRDIALTSDDLKVTFDVNTAVSPDEDSDGLSACKEQQLGTNPHDPDTDHDGATDGAEVNVYHTDPLHPDPFVDLALAVKSSAQSVAVGAKLDYTLSVLNNGPHAATKTHIENTLPVGAIYLDASRECIFNPPHTVRCALDAMDVGATRQITITVLVSAAAVTSTSSNTVMVNTTRVVDEMGKELDDRNNSARTVIDVISTRALQGLQALYRFQEGHGCIIHDVSGVEPALDLQVCDGLGNRPAVQWTPDGMLMSPFATVASIMPAAGFVAGTKESRELTVEAWLVPTNITDTTAIGHTTPASILTLSGDTGSNFVLAQGRQSLPHTDLLEARLRTTATGDGSKPGLLTPNGTIAPVLTHVVFTRGSDNVARIYVNGRLAAERRLEGDFANWNSGYRFRLGNSVSGDEPWQGTFYEVALYSHALIPQEVVENFVAGPAGDLHVHMQFMPALSR